MFNHRFEMMTDKELPEDDEFQDRLYNAFEQWFVSYMALEGVDTGGYAPQGHEINEEEA